MSVVLGLIAFGGGAWLLVESVEGLVGALRGWAAAAGMSGVVLAALVLGFDVESTAAGVAATLDDLPGTALGTSIGAAILLMTLGLGLAGVVAPFAVRPPAPVLLVAAFAAALPSGLSLDGELSRVDGAVLVAVFPLLVTVVWRARRTGAAEADGDASGERAVSLRRLAPRLLATVTGLVAGAELLVFGTERIVDELSLSETAFGLLVVAAAVSFEELVLELLPAHRGFPELSVGNALGTLVFLCTGSLGVVALVRPLPISDAVRTWHVPALLTTTALTLVLLARGRLGRAEGIALCTLYAGYVTGSVLVGT